VRRAITALALVLALAGCGFLPEQHDASSSGAMAHMARDLGWGECPIEVWVTGVIVPSREGAATIRDEQGIARGIVWGSANTGFVDWGYRYRIGGRWFNTPDTFWACGGADAVIRE
jgi:hypothetical protein